MLSIILLYINIPSGYDSLIDIIFYKINAGNLQRSKLIFIFLWKNKLKYTPSSTYHIQLHIHTPAFKFVGMCECFITWACLRDWAYMSVYVCLCVYVFCVYVCIYCVLYVCIYVCLVVCAHVWIYVYVFIRQLIA